MSIDKKILSVDSDVDDIDYVAFTTYLQEDTKRKLDMVFAEIDRQGEDYLKEIEEKKFRQNIEKAKFVKYIMKYIKGVYTVERLMGYEYADVLYMYQELKEKRKSKLKTFFDFLFNL